MRSRRLTRCGRRSASPADRTGRETEAPWTSSRGVTETADGRSKPDRRPSVARTPSGGAADPEAVRQGVHQDGSGGNPQRLWRGDALRLRAGHVRLRQRDREVFRLRGIRDDRGEGRPRDAGLAGFDGGTGDRPLQSRAGTRRRTPHLSERRELLSVGDGFEALTCAPSS